MNGACLPCCVPLPQDSQQQHCSRMVRGYFKQAAQTQPTCLGQVGDDAGRAAVVNAQPLLDACLGPCLGRAAAEVSRCVHAADATGCAVAVRDAVPRIRSGINIDASNLSGTCRQTLYDV
jgi:hypothetical protein